MGKTYEVAQITGHSYDDGGQLVCKVEWRYYPSDCFTWQTASQLQGAKEKVNDYEKTIGIDETLTAAERQQVLKDKAVVMDLAAEEAGAHIKIKEIGGHIVHNDILSLQTVWTNGEVLSIKKENFPGPADMLHKYLQQNHLRVSVKGSTIVTPAREASSRAATTPATPKPGRAKSPSPASANSSARAPRAASTATPTSARVRAAAQKKKTADVPKVKNTIDKAKPAPTGVIKIATRGRPVRATAAAVVSNAASAVATPATASARAPRSRAAAGGSAIPINILSFEKNTTGDRFVVVSAGDGSAAQVIAVEDYRRAHPDEYKKKLEETVFGRL